MSKKPHDTPMLDQLESGPWPSFVTGLKRLAKDNDYMTDLMGQLEHSYKTRKGYWKGGTVGVFGYGGGVIPRFSEVADMFPASKEFHTLRVQPPAGMHYNTEVPLPDVTITIIDRNGKTIALEKMTKIDAAHKILDHVKMLSKKKGLCVKP